MTTPFIFRNLGISSPGIFFSTIKVRFDSGDKSGSAHALKDWFKEIEEELEFLAKRKKEVESEVTEFLRALRANGNASRFYHS